jgi:hypothetical protein
VPPTPLWEFQLDLAQCPAPAPALMPSDITGDCNVGLTFGKPIITKLGNEWVVMVTSGYNNSNGATGDGFGYLYVINAMNGKLKYKISTGEGSGTNPSGLAQINNYVDNVDLDNKTLRAYGGDVLGNIFRFEFPPLATNASATLIGIARDPRQRERQPITVRPELAELDGKPFVIVGTGRLLGGDDVAPCAAGSIAEAIGVRASRHARRGAGLSGADASGVAADAGVPERGDAVIGDAARDPLRRIGRRMRAAARMGPRPGGGRRARQRRDEARPRRARLREQHAVAGALHRRWPQLVQPGGLPHGGADPELGHVAVPLRFAQRRLQRPPAAAS